MPRILFIAMTESVHTARWLNELQELNWDVHLFPSQGWGIHPAIKNVTVHGIDIRPEKINKNIRFAGAIPFAVPHISDRGNIVLQRLRDHFASSQTNEGGYRVRQLIKVIKKIKPGIVHTLEMQHAGYLALQARRLWDLHSLRGSLRHGVAIFIFLGVFRIYRGKIEKVLAFCDYYGPKSERDIRLANEFGFKGKVLPVLPGNGGLDTAKLRSYWQTGRCSDKKIILVKGYQGVMNRALVTLHAIQLRGDVLKDFSIVIYLGVEDVKINVASTSHDLGISITWTSYLPHEELLKIYGKARISIGLSISDGSPTPPGIYDVGYLSHRIKHKLRR